MHHITTRTVLFISGAFMSHYYWEKWVSYFEDKGYKVVVPPWLHKNDTPENLREENACNKIDSINLSGLLCYYTEIIDQLQEKPILIGHSYGGLLVQMLAEKNLASAAICISSFPPAGFSVKKKTFFKNIVQFSSNFFSAKSTCFLPFKDWKDVFFNTASNEEQIIAYENFVIPESKTALRDLLFRNTRINFKKKHVPLFFIGGSEDKIVTTELLYWNFKKYKNFHSITCYKRMEDQDHFLILQTDWKETAESIVTWLDKIR